MTKAIRWHASISDAKQIPNEENRLSSLILEDQDMQVRFYSPKNKDDQIPHGQDELYVISNGSGIFVMNHEEISFNVGDVIFVPKNEHHYFKEFSDDFATWVIFYGSKN